MYIVGCLQGRFLEFEYFVSRGINLCDISVQFEFEVD